MAEQGIPPELIAAQQAYTAAEEAVSAWHATPGDETELHRLRAACLDKQAGLAKLREQYGFTSRAAIERLRRAARERT